MKREDKDLAIAELTELLKNSKVLYITDTSNLNAEATTKLRRECFKKEVSLTVVKNTLLRKAMERVEDVDYSGLYDTLKGTSAIMTAEVSNLPARLIKAFRTSGKKATDKPAIKGAFVEESIYVGDDQLDTLCNLKSKNELIADVVALLQSPAKNVISALQSAPQTVAGLVKTLSEKEG